MNNTTSHMKRTATFLLTARLQALCGAACRRLLARVGLASGARAWRSRMPAVLFSGLTPTCLFVCALLATAALAGELKFQRHSIDETLPQNDTLKGDYGLTALVDIDRDGDLDFVCGGRQPKPERLYWFEFQSAGRWVRHEIGTSYQSDVGLAALDVDGDGWIDLVCSGVWFRNPGNPREGKWERIEFAPNAGGAHDILAADIDGDGRKDIVMMSDSRKPLNALCWFKIPADPRQRWERHHIGPGIHGAITPAGVADINGDGHLDVVRGDTWFENRDGKGTEWIPHANIPMGRKGPFGVCVRTADADVDGNGRPAIVMCDTDISESKIVILRTADKGESWTKQELPQSLPYGSTSSAMNRRNCCPPAARIRAGSSGKISATENSRNESSSTSSSAATSCRPAMWMATATSTSSPNRGARSRGMAPPARSTSISWRTS